MNIRDITQKELQPKLDQKQDLYQPFRAVIVASDGSRTLGSPWKDQNRRLVWFQRAEAGLTGNIGWAYCDVLEPDVGLGVWMRKDPDLGQFIVIRDDPIQRSGTSPTTSYLSLSNTDFLRGGRFQLWLEPEMMTPLAVYPAAAGLAVNVFTGDYFYANERKTFAGEANFDLSGSQPAGPDEHLLVGLYLDDANTLQSVDGAAVATAITAPQPVWPDVAHRLATVEINDTQTTIDIADVDNKDKVWADQQLDDEIYKVKVSSDDTTPDYLEQKVIGTANRITATVVNPAGNEDLQLDAGSTILDTTTAGQINGLAEKAVPLDADIVLIEDSAAGNAKKKVQLGNLPGGGGGAWPADGKAMIDTTEYDTIQEAIDAAAIFGADTIKIGAGTFTEVLTIDIDVKLIGTGRESTIITSTATKTVIITELGIYGAIDVYLHGLTIKNTASLAGEMIALYIQTTGTVTVEDCDLIADLNGSGAGRALRQETDAATTNLIDCRLVCDNADGGSTDNDALNVAAGTVNVWGGSLDGQVYDIQTYLAGTTVNLYPEVIFINETILANSSSVIDSYVDLPRLLSNANDFCRYDNASDSDFVATINGAPVGASVVYNAPSSGDENNLIPNSVNQLAKMVLHNTTRGDYALISTSNAGTNTITLTAAAPGTWQNGDTITIRSQTNTATVFSSYFVDFEIVSGLSDIAIGFEVTVTARDTGAASQRVILHPYEANADSKRKSVETQVANVRTSATVHSLSVISSRFCCLWEASGSGTMLIVIRITKEFIR